MFKSLLAAAALCSVAPAFAAANLLTDGSFESAVLPDGDYGMYGGSSLYGWTAVGSGLIEVRRDIVGTAQDGDYFVELDSTANSAMSQTISTVAGQRYSLSFWYSNRPASFSYNSVFPGGVAPASTNGLSFDVGSGAVNVPGLPANTSADNTWTLYSTSFVATGASTTLTFAAGDALGEGLRGPAQRAARAAPLLNFGDGGLVQEGAVATPVIAPYAHFLPRFDLPLAQALATLFGCAPFSSPPNE